MGLKVGLGNIWVTVMILPLVSVEREVEVRTVDGKLVIELRLSVVIIRTVVGGEFLRKINDEIYDTRKKAKDYGISVICWEREVEVEDVDGGAEVEVEVVDGVEEEEEVEVEVV